MSDIAVYMIANLVVHDADEYSRPLINRRIDKGYAVTLCLRTKLYGGDEFTKGMKS